MADDRSEPDSDAHGGWFGRHQQVAWIGVIGSVLVALIALVPPILEYLDDDAAEPRAAPPAPSSVAASAPPETSPPTSDASSPPPAEPTTPDPPSPPAPSEHWQGRLLLDSGPKDLDEAQPVAVGYADEGDIFMVGDMRIGGWNGTTISLWYGDSAEPPGYEECAATIDAEGDDTQDFTEDSVLCVRTSAGNLARLTFLESRPGTGHTVVFDAVVWAVG